MSFQACGTKSAKNPVSTKAKGRGGAGKQRTPRTTICRAPDLARWDEDIVSAFSNEGKNMKKIGIGIAGTGARAAGSFGPWLVKEGAKLKYITIQNSPSEVSLLTRNAVVESKGRLLLIDCFLDSSFYSRLLERRLARVIEAVAFADDYFFDAVSEQPDNFANQRRTRHHSGHVFGVAHVGLHENLPLATKIRAFNSFL